LKFPTIIDDHLSHYEFQCCALRSGISAGVLNFQDIHSDLHFWCVLEITVDPPSPEEIVDVKITSKNPIWIKIPIRSPNPDSIIFHAEISDNDLNGIEDFTSVSNLTTDYFFDLHLCTQCI
jgi:hypothetical protein